MGSGWLRNPLSSEARGSTTAKAIFLESGSPFDPDGRLRRHGLDLVRPGPMHRVDRHLLMRDNLTATRWPPTSLFGRKAVIGEIHSMASGGGAALIAARWLGEGRRGDRANVQRGGHAAAANQSPNRRADIAGLRPRSRTQDATEAR